MLSSQCKVNYRAVSYQGKSFRKSAPKSYLQEAHTTLCLSQACTNQSNLQTKCRHWTSQHSLCQKPILTIVHCTIFPHLRACFRESGKFCSSRQVPIRFIRSHCWWLLLEHAQHLRAAHTGPRNLESPPRMPAHLHMTPCVDLLPSLAKALMTLVWSAVGRVQHLGDLIHVFICLQSNTCILSARRSGLLTCLCAPVKPEL